MTSKSEALSYRELTPEEKELLNKLYDERAKKFQIQKHPKIKMGPKGYLVPKHYLTMAEDVYDMEIRPGDVVVATYQRSGTTLVQELTWLVAHDFDYESARVLLTERYDFVEFSMFFDEESEKEMMKGAGDSSSIKEMIKLIDTTGPQKLKDRPSPRFIKTHQPLSLLPPTMLDTAKVIYVARDPRDVCVSSYHHARLFKFLGSTGTVENTWEAFRRDLYMQTPFFEHLKEAWNVRHNKNMLFLFYEDVIKDMPGTIRRVAKFLGKSEPSAAQTAGLCEHLRIDNFRNNKYVNLDEMEALDLLSKDEVFIRQGKAGGWRDVFSPEMAAEAERWIADNLRDTDLRFPAHKQT